MPHLDLDPLILQFSKRLRTVIGSRSQRDFAQETGLSEGVIRSYLRGKTYPTLDRLAALARASQVRIEWLATGESPMRTQDLGTVHDKLNGYLILPCVDPGNQDPTPQLAFQRSWLDNLFPTIAIDHIAIIIARGDSMAPAITEGDVLLVNIHEHTVKHAGIYIVKVNNIAGPKRLETLPGGRIMIRSDNDAYPASWVDPDDQIDFKVLGRLIWVAHKL